MNECSYGHDVWKGEVHWAADDERGLSPLECVNVPFVHGVWHFVAGGILALVADIVLPQNTLSVTFPHVVFMILTQGPRILRCLKQLA